jgi:hypothetical protein
VAEGRKGLTVAAPVTYRIRVQGVLDESWSNRVGGMSICHMHAERQPPVTVLYGELADQAALAGVLNYLYELGYPLLSVECL